MAFDTRGVEVGQLWQVVRPDYWSSRVLLDFKKLVLNYAAKIKTPKSVSGNDTGEV
jgi:hypothetical protein